MTNLDSVLKSRTITLLTKACIIKVMFFFSSHVWMWELDHKQGWKPKNWCFWTVVPEKTFESLLDSKEIKPINPKGNQPWIFIGRPDAEVEVPIVWPPDMNRWLIGKDPDSGIDWGQEKRVTEDEMAGQALLTQWTWVHWNVTPGDSERQESLVCCSPWGHKESDTT